LPFTATHILAIVPIYAGCRILPFSALAIGAMIPDFPMFVTISSYDFSRSLIGIALYCVPASFVMHWLFKKLILPFCIDLSPSLIRARLTHYKYSRTFYDFKNIVLLSLCFAVGSFSHIAWDSFTHNWGWGVAQFPFLKQQVSLFNFSLPYYKVFQYGSTMLGLPILLLIAALKFRTLPATKAKRYTFSPQKTVAITGSFLLLPFIIYFYHSYFNANDLSTIIGYTIKQSIGAGIAILVVYSYLYSRDHNIFG
jgi:hypothetical protein